MLVRTQVPLRRSRVRTSGNFQSPYSLVPTTERITDAFFGPDAETLTGEEALSRRIQVINDLVVIFQLEEPSLRAKMCRWAMIRDDIQEATIRSSLKPI
jgi:hypothetical protein